jgi:hypothetical protein
MLWLRLAFRQTRRSSSVGVDLPNQFQLFNIYSIDLRGEPSMNGNNGCGIAYIVCLAILMTAGFATTAYSQQSKPKAAALPKYSRDWTTVVQKIVWTFDAKRMMRIGERAGLEITTERAGDRQTIWFDDPVTHETVLSVSICEDAFPISASARVPISTTNQKDSAH